MLKSMFFIMRKKYDKKSKQFYVCVGGNHFELEGQTKVMLIEKYET